MIKQLFTVLIAASIAMSPVTLTSCGHKSEAIDRMVKELNSPQFKAREVETGLFTDSSAKLEGDTLALTFFCRPALDLTAITPAQLPALRESALQEFKAFLADKSFKEGIEALRHNNMSLLLVWQDTNGQNIRIELAPEEILSATNES